MEFTGQNKIELFADNAQLIKKEFTWQNNMTKRLAALLYAQAGKAADCAAIRQCHNLIKQNTGVFSIFRGDLAICVASLLSLSPKPEQLFNETLKVYDMLKSEKLRSSDYLAIAAYQIAVQSRPSDYTNIVTRIRRFYDGMKAQHFFHTGKDDYIFAAMLGLSNLNVETGTVHIEQLYSRLKDEFWNKNSVQTLAQVLVLGNSNDQVVDRILALRDVLRAQKTKLDKTYTLPILGILALLPVEIDILAREINAAQEVLQTRKGFGSFSVASQERLLFAASIVAGEYAENENDEVLMATVSTSITNLIIAQEAAMIAAASSAAAAGAATSS